AHGLPPLRADGAPTRDTRAPGARRPLAGPAATRGGVFARREDGDSGAGPTRPGAAAVARSRGTPRVRVLPARHALAVCRAQHANRRSRRADGASPHERRFRGVLDGRRAHAATASTDPHHSRQPLDAYAPERAHVSGRAPKRASALHAALFLLAEPGRAVVREDRA